MIRSTFHWSLFDWMCECARKIEICLCMLVDGITDEVSVSSDETIHQLWLTAQINSVLYLPIFTLCNYDDDCGMQMLTRWLRQISATIAIHTWNYHATTTNIEMKHFTFERKNQFFVCLWQFSPQYCLKFISIYLYGSLIAISWISYVNKKDDDNNEQKQMEKKNQIKYIIN